MIVAFCKKYKDLHSVGDVGLIHFAIQGSGARTQPQDSGGQVTPHVLKFCMSGLGMLRLNLVFRESLPCSLRVW